MHASALTLCLHVRTRAEQPAVFTPTSACRSARCEPPSVWSACRVMQSESSACQLSMARHAWPSLGRVLVLGHPTVLRGAQLLAADAAAGSILPDQPHVEAQMPRCCCGCKHVVLKPKCRDLGDNSKEGQRQLAAASFALVLERGAPAPAAAAAAEGKSDDERLRRLLLTIPCAARRRSLPRRCVLEDGQPEAQQSSTKHASEHTRGREQRSVFLVTAYTELCSLCCFWSQGHTTPTKTMQASRLLLCCLLACACLGTLAEHVQKLDRTNFEDKVPAWHPYTLVCLQLVSKDGRCADYRWQTSIHEVLCAVRVTCLLYSDPGPAQPVLTY